MDYQNHYDRLISRAKNRTPPLLKEDHHIIPKCMGGSNDSSNIASLTPEEHYTAHQLLVKIYPDNQNLIYAVLMMCQARDGVVRNNKLYGWHKKRLSEARKNVPKTAEHKKKLRDANLGKILSDETCTKMSKSRIGNTYGKGNKGKIKPQRTQEHKDNLGKSLQKPKSAEGKKNIGLGAIKRSIKIIIEKRELYLRFFEMIDRNITKQSIKSALNIRERQYYGYLGKRLHIENIIKEYEDAQSLKSQG